ncbi:metallophosphoesterase [Acidithiobacillus sp. M4-SHS-6]|uniref:metallophosphoesterase n=1 Tax=Acidithiobacillus sp. M4-SHS-6 TaxID=3383024 RepID=UPI0039BE53D4
MFEKNPWKVRFAPNASGRDFVVGDLHGSLPLLHEKLETVSFDIHRDRLFSVGDLIDRGENSPGCLSLLREPWFHAVLGNHDAMLMGWLLSQDPHLRDNRAALYANAFRYNAGYDWVFSHMDAAMAGLAWLETLPFIIEVQRRFQIVHAELINAAIPRNVAPETENSALSDIHYIEGFGMAGDWRDHCLWGRSLPRMMYRNKRRDRRQHSADTRKKWRETVNMLELPVYCGHTILPESVTFMGHTFLDTGAYRTGKLTLISA